MSKLLHKIDPRSLQPGMFIEELDRPWLETPLKFQSFYVRSLNDVQWIRENCRFVMVDPGKSDASLIFHRPEPTRRLSDDSELTRECMAHASAGGSRHEGATIKSVDSSPRGSQQQTDLPERRQTKRPWFPWRRRFGDATTVQMQEIALADERAQRKQHVARAEHTWREAHKVMSGVMTELRAGGALDVSSVERAVFPIIDCVLQSSDAMAFVLRMKATDDYLYNHALAVSIWAVVFGKSLGFDRRNLEILGMGGLLLDIGKMRVPRDLLSKSTALDAAELAELRRHVDYSLAIMDESHNVDPKIYEMVRTHHERHDGSGYPQRLSGNAIPLFGRIAGLIDTYDAMTSQRPYAQAHSTYAVMQILIDASGTLFQNELIERFIRVVGIFPTASIVELNTREVGIVVEQNALRRLRPKVMVILDANKQLRSEFPVVDLAETSSQADEPGAVWIVQGLQPGAWGIDAREYYL